jgi:hypothetical protein
MAVQLSDKVVMAASVYPKEANPLWGDIYNNRCSYFKSYSSHTFDYPIQKRYPYRQRIRNGISYDLLEFGRPDANG